jgi:hypothetical protein
VNTQVTQHGPFEGDHRREWRSQRHASPKAIRRINGFVVMLILLLTLFVMLGMACNKSPSAPVGLYRLIISPPAKGEYVALAMPLKMIAGLPGDWISTTPLGTYINSTLVPNSAPLLPQHYPYGTFELGPSSLWLIDKDPRSWDIRRRQQERRRAN